MSRELPDSEQISNPVLLAIARELTPFAQGLVQAAEAIRQSEEFRTLVRGMAALAKAIPKQEVVLSPELLRILQNIPEWAKNLEANTALLNEGFARLEQSKYRAILQVFSLRDLVEYADLDQTQIDQKLYALTARTEYHDNLLNLYSATKLSSERVSLLREALMLHQEQRFAGSVTLMHSQIEGILGDALVALGAAEKVGPRKLRVSGQTTPNLNGLDAKLKLANSSSGGSDIFGNLLKNCIVAESVELNLAQFRNGVMHGTDTSFATPEQSTQLVLWLTALIIKMRVMSPRADGEGGITHA